MQFRCQRQLKPILRPIESYSGACACAASAPDDKATSTAANPHFINAIVGIGASDRQARLIRRPSSDQRGHARTRSCCGTVTAAGKRKRRRLSAPPLTRRKRGNYFSEVETLSNVELSL